MSVGVHPSDETLHLVSSYLDRLSPEGLRKVGTAYVEILSKPADRDESAPKNTEYEALDARYSRELLDLLPGVVAKASSLDQLDIKRDAVQRYFEEAHRCYLFGLKKACVVLCRAILESALKEIFGPTHRPHELRELAEQAGPSGKPLLDGERIQSCERVFSAGDCAIHHENLFERNYRDSDVERVLLDTRKVLEDLYSKPS